MLTFLSFMNKLLPYLPKIDFPNENIKEKQTRKLQLFQYSNIYVRDISDFCLRKKICSKYFVAVKSILTVRLASTTIKSAPHIQFSHKFRLSCGAVGKNAENFMHSLVFFFSRVVVALVCVQNTQINFSVHYKW